MSELGASEILARFDEERRTLSPPGFRREKSPGVSRSIPRGSKWGWIEWSSHSPAEIDAAIENEIAHFTALGCSFEWKVYDHDAPADLRQRLAARGFVVGGAEAFLVVPIRDLVLPEGAPADVRRVETAGQLEEYLSVEQAMWPDDGGISWTESERRFREHANAEGYYVGYADGQPVSSARITFREGSHFAGLFGAATREAFRGRGLYTSLVAARAAEACQRGVHYLFADAAPTSRPILERRGFRCLSHTYPCTWRVDQA